MKTFKLIRAAMLLFALSLAAFNVTSAQTNSGTAQQGNQQVSASTSPYLAAANVDDNAHKNAANNKKPTTVALTFVDNMPVGVGHLLSIDFKIGTTTYSFWNFQINGSTIPQGSYTITLHISNPNGSTTYSTSLVGGSDCYYYCQPYDSRTNLVQTLPTADLSSCTSLVISSNPTHCPSTGP